MDNSGKLRTLNDVENIINFMDLSNETLKPTVQAIYLGDVLDNYKLLELNDDIMNKINNGENVKFRGEINDKAVLCTDSNTYEVRELETSNSLLLLPDLSLEENEDVSSNKKLFHKEVVGIHHKYYELKSCKPDFQKLRQILETCEYAGPSSDMQSIEEGMRLYSSDELLDVIQASASELNSELKKLDAFELDGKIRILEFSYKFRMLSVLFNWIEENSWSNDEISYEDTVTTLHDLVPSPIMKYLFDTYMNISNKLSSSGDRLYKFNEYKVCRFMGEMLLRNTNIIGLGDFTRTWQDSVPDNLTTSLSQIDGLAYISELAGQQVLNYFPESKLPGDVSKRMKALFKAKDKWTFEQIKPYIEPITTAGMTDSLAILVKYCRTSTINGVKYYSSIYGK